MQHQIASYLFQQKRCYLPGLGTLAVLYESAESDFTNKTIHAPRPSISFIEESSDDTGLINYLAESGNKSGEEVSQQLQQFSNDIKNQLSNSSEVVIGQAGSFFVDASGQIRFRGIELPAAFLQPVHAERVIHPQAEHQMLVGDRETTNTAMTELLAPRTEVKQRWWIWALILSGLALILIFIYFSELKGGASFGNGIKI